MDKIKDGSNKRNNEIPEPFCNYQVQEQVRAQEIGKGSTRRYNHSDKENSQQSVILLALLLFMFKR